MPAKEHDPLLRHNPVFVAFWLAQTISPLGDRVHQIALAVLVYNLSNSAPLTALVFFCGYFPYLVIGPLAGVYVDRHDRRRTLIAADVIRAVLVLLVPLAAWVSPVLTLPLTFLITSVSMFFRPARLAVVPQIVRPEQLMAANSAANVADTLADLGGYPLAALVTAILTPIIWIAFVFDSITYLASALLLRSLPTVPPTSAPRAVRIEFFEGLNALRRDHALFENTVLCSVGQIGVAAFTSLLLVFSVQSLHDGLLPYTAAYPALAFSSGIGCIVGAVAAERLDPGVGHARLILTGFAGTALVLLLMGLCTSTLNALAIVFVGGIANLLWLVPAQTMFMERLPNELLGRVMAARTAVTFGAISVWIGGISGLAAVMSASQIFLGAAVITALATLAGFARVAVRHPEREPGYEAARQPA